MLERWGDFYLVAGGAAAVLIGLIFVVISLMQDRSRSSVLSGSKLFMGPIVLGLSFVLVLTGAVLTPHITAGWLGAITAVVAFWGLVRGIMSIMGIKRLGSEVHWSDVWFYGVIPSALYVVLGIVGFAIRQGLPWAEYGLAVVVTALLLTAIRNEWDLITWIAPRPESNDEFGAH
jgi:hypothetical protein